MCAQLFEESQMAAPGSLFTRVELQQTRVFVFHLQDPKVSTVKPHSAGDYGRAMLKFQRMPIG